MSSGVLYVQSLCAGFWKKVLIILQSCILQKSKRDLLLYCVDGAFLCGFKDLLGSNVCGPINAASLLEAHFSNLALKSPSTCVGPALVCF